MLRFFTRFATPRCALASALLFASLYPAAAAEAQLRTADPTDRADSAAACANLAVARVATPAAAGDAPRFVTPPDPHGPTLVDLGLFIVDITHIDEVDNTFRIQGSLDLVWCDPRLAFDPEAAGTDTMEFLEGDAVREIGRIWWPDLDFVNQTEPRRVENETLVIRADGTVDYQELFVAALKSPFDLTRFPFDRQQLEIEIESFSWTADALRFHEETDKIGFSDRFEMPEWRVLTVESSVATRREVRDRAPFSEFALGIEVARKPGYYLWKLVLPLLLLVGASWIVFWMTGELFTRRLGLAFRGVLIVVAFQFVIGGSLPRVSYLTLMDSFLLLSFVMMLLTILENMVVSRCYQAEREDAAHRIDTASRWLFPLAYAFGICALLALYLR